MGDGVPTSRPRARSLRLIAGACLAIAAIVAAGLLISNASSKQTAPQYKYQIVSAYWSGGSGGNLQLQTRFLNEAKVPVTYICNFTDRGVFIGVDDDPLAVTP